MPEGTEILAAREGRVVQIVQNNTESCPKEECKKYNNYIIIMHADGTYGYYAHIKYNGSKVKPGDYVQKENVLGTVEMLGGQADRIYILPVFCQPLTNGKHWRPNSELTTEKMLYS